MASGNPNTELVDKAVSEGGAYDVIRDRLVEQGDALEQKTGALNKARAQEFGSTDMAVVARARVRTEHNCVGRDLVHVGNFILFGYNVFIGLKKSTRIEDVFALYQTDEDSEHYQIQPIALAGTFLDDPRFRQDFDELYKYYKNTQLIQLAHRNGKLLAGFQIGDRIDDSRVFRWAVSPDGEITYIDNRGERDLALPEPYDFEWIESVREDVVHGRFPHVNILDTVFIETLNGSLTIKVENNTEVGEGVFSEPVDDPSQSLNDAEIFYAKLGSLILIKVLPYKEVNWRYLIFNIGNAHVRRVDSIGNSCIQLPEDHGIIFPDGIYLDNGEFKTFGTGVDGLRFKRRIQSPNGEDVLYVFYEPVHGVFALLSYNLITKSLQNPIITNGYARAPNGKIVVFVAGDEPTRIHPMQIWDTPFVSDEFANAAPVGQNFFTRIGNPGLVRGISDLYSLVRQIREETVSVGHYEALHRAAGKLFDSHFWIADEEAGGIDVTVQSVSDTVELIVDEFEKVESIRRHSAQALHSATNDQQGLMAELAPADWPSVNEYVSALDRIRRQRGHLATIRTHRYMDIDQVEEMDAELIEMSDTVSERTAQFLAQDGALQSYESDIEALDTAIESHATVAEMQPDLAKLDEIAGGLDLLSEIVSTLNVADATVQTKILESISDVYAHLNRSRAVGKQRRDRIGSAESVEQFSAQFKLFSQSITNALGLANTPEKCEEQLARLLVQLEEMESQFGEHDKFLSDIMDKREEVHDTFSAHRQQLLDARQARAQTLAEAAARMLTNIERRTGRFNEADELNTYLASDALVLKVRDIVNQLRALDSTVKADDVQARMKMIRDTASRSLRDRSELYVEGGSVIKLGPIHRFSVNTEELDLTIIPKGDKLALHLIGTQYFETLEDERFEGLRPYWHIASAAESDSVYRAEYLAYQIVQAAQSGTDQLDWPQLQSAVGSKGVLEKIVRAFSAPRYKDGYEKGVHDSDACSLLAAIVPAIDNGDLLRFSPTTRALGQLAWAALVAKQGGADRVRADEDPLILQSLASSAASMHRLHGDATAVRLVENRLRGLVQNFSAQYGIEISDLLVDEISAYVAAELGHQAKGFIRSTGALSLNRKFSDAIRGDGEIAFTAAIEALSGRYAAQFELAQAWLNAVVAQLPADDQADSLGSIDSHYIPESAVELVLGAQIDRRDHSFNPAVIVSGLYGTHDRIVDGALNLTLDGFWSRLKHHCDVHVPALSAYHELRQTTASAARHALRLNEFKARPLSSFVRNRLINDAYLPMIGDNLAKQIGTVGEDKRSDLNGLLMMISPPGYGKTTLMEYVASRLGLTFMKINCPALGHDVSSLDPAAANNATSRQELEKLNLALEMGDNVMLYLDDIQHTAPEFLQKFISLCDSTRRIEGVWKGNTRTYDMRGRKFCVVMSGNPYTESGETFKVPDMLANRADIYNLGDLLSGKETQFELSYIENCLTSNGVLAPLATRDMSDVYKLIDLAKGKEVATTDLSHGYSGAEISEITRVLKRLLTIQAIVLKVNQQYIASAAQEDKYRIEPRFLLQGSYRNMNKLAEKVSSVMNDEELEALIDDHYKGEAQLLTQGAEANMLKLGELRGTLDEGHTKRWAQIKADFLREKALGGDGADAGQKIAVQLSDLVLGVGEIGSVLQSDRLSEAMSNQHRHQEQTAQAISDSIESLGKAVKGHETSVNISNTPSPEFARVLTMLNDTIEQTLFPLVRTMDARIGQDVEALEQLQRLAADVSALKNRAGG